MKTYIAGNTRQDKAMFILASMAPDMVEDIINLVNQRGRGILADLASDNEDGPPAPLAMFSRDFIADGDFKDVYVGFLTTVLASMRTLKSDFDFYESTLKNAFSLPSEIAKPMAKKIETYDVLGGSEEARAKLAWYNKLSMKLQEGIRRTVNFFPSLLGIGWENDQDQDYDIDFLYELKLLGKAVDDLAARARLMKGQASIAASMNVFRASDGTNPSGDVYGDIYGDPSDIAELKLIDTVKPLMGNPLPALAFGGLKKLFAIGQNASSSKLNSAVTSAGASQDPAKKGQVTDPAMKAALQRLISGEPSTIASVDGVDVSRGQLAKCLELLSVARQQGQTGDAYEEVAEQFGDAVADAWRRGNVPAMFAGVLEAAGDVFETTGDPELDEAIAADVVNDNDFTYGDVEGDLDREMGGLFTRAKINRQIRKGKRRQRRVAKKMARQARKDRLNQQLIDARNFADDQTMQMTAAPMQQYSPGSMNAGMASPFYDPEAYAGENDFDPYFSNSGFDNPDDFYNVDQLDPTPTQSSY